jgi:hypothetical protein
LHNFIQSVPTNLISRIPFIHLVWPTWNKRHLFSRPPGPAAYHDEFWGHAEQDLLVAKSEWEELWRLFSTISVKRLHITIFYEWNESDQILSVQDLLPILCSVQVEGEFSVEAWGPEDRIEEPSAEHPFRIRYNPLLGRQGSNR